MSQQVEPDTVKTTESPQQASKPSKSKPRNRDKDVLATKRRCVSTACIACRRRKSKCDGNTPSCAACASVYGTECIYDPNSDHRRKGVYKKDIDNLKTRNSTLQTLIQGILNYPESEVMDLVRDIRTCESLDDVAEEILARDSGLAEETESIEDLAEGVVGSEGLSRPNLEKELAGKMGALRLDNGSVQFLGGTSNLLFTDSGALDDQSSSTAPGTSMYQSQEDAIRSWTNVTHDVDLIIHLLNMYFTWHYTYFTTLSKVKFFQDFFQGKPTYDRGRRTEYCTSLLVNAMLALGCHFTSWPGARRDKHDSATAGDHFFKEAKRLIVENDEYEHPRLATVQALALMSVREAGCGREAKGWVYSGMSFRMACDLGLNFDTENANLDEHEVDARRITFWGCFLFDKCWSNYLGRPPQLPITNTTVPKFEVFPSEDSDMWSPWTDAGVDRSQSQPSRTRAVALQIANLCEISNDLLLNFYRPTQTKPLTRPAEVKRLSDFHTRLEGWRKVLPKEMEPREGQLPNVLVMHMFFHLLFIHLFRPFLKYTSNNSPLPSHVSPRKICTQAAAMISKLLRLYKRTYGVRQICNIAVYIAHSACTIHLLNLPDKDARRDITHGVRQLEEIGEGWLCARRTLVLLAIQARRWNITLPDEAAAVLAKAEAVHNNSPSPQSTTDHSFDNTYLFMQQPSSQQDDHVSPSNHPNQAVPSAAGRSLGTDSPEASSVTSTLADHMSPTLHPATAALTTESSAQQVFSSAETLFTDSKDWWLKDQSSIFDNWARRESFPTTSGYAIPASMATNGLDLGMGMTQPTASDMGVFNMNGAEEMDSQGPMATMIMPDSNGLSPTQPGQAQMSGMEYGQGTAYQSFPRPGNGVYQ